MEKLEMKVSMTRIDVHGLKMQGSQGFQEKLPEGVPLFGFYCIFISKCFEICRGGGAISTLTQCASIR
jgi:hypothetical protein